MVDLLIQAETVVDGAGAEPGWLLVRESQIVERGTGETPREPDYRVAAVLPPFVDIHTHGAVGVDFGQVGADPAPAIAHHRGRGSTVIEAWIATGTLPAMAARVRELAGFVQTGELAGIHLEGPWLSVEQRGAHDPALQRNPELAEVEALLGAGDGAVRMVTIAPELPGALEAIRFMAANGVVAALGHTAAYANTVRRAIDAGANEVTHVFNGMLPLHHREVHLPGVALTDRRLWVELIADGQRVNDDAGDLVVQAAGDRLLLVSDAMAATGLGDGEYLLAGSKVRVRDGAARLAEGNSLAGSTSVIADAVQRLLARGTGLADITNWTNVHPAAVPRRGAPRLRVGDRADLVVIQDGRVARVLSSGVWQD